MYNIPAAEIEIDTCLQFIRPCSSSRVQPALASFHGPPQSKSWPSALFLLLGKLPIRANHPALASVVYVVATADELEYNYRRNLTDVTPEFCLLCGSGFFHSDGDAASQMMRILLPH